MKNYVFEKTRSRSLFRVVDEFGNWRHYFHKPSGLYLRATNYILHVGFNKGDRFMDYLIRSTPEEARKKLTMAGEKGNKIHNFITHLLINKGKATIRTRVWNRLTERDEMLTFQEWKCIVSFQHFWQQHKPILILFETPVFDLKRLYAGTPDAVLILTKVCGVKSCPCKKLVGKIGLFDWKSGAGIWDDYGPQNASYSNAESMKKMLKGRSIEYTAVLRLGTRHVKTNGYELKAYDKKETETHWKEFLASIVVANATYKPFDPSVDIYDIPEKISIKITREKLKVKNKKKVVKNKK